MLEIFIYPVSAVMKLWHMLLHSVLGLDDSLSWLLSIFGLIIVVRGITTPLQWMSLRSARLGVILRPKLAALTEEYQNETSVEKLKEKEEKGKALRKELGYSLRSGCLPPLIQIPFFLGLYQVLIRMARPADGLDTTNHEPIGFLTSADVTSFLQTRFGNVPASAYIAMSDEQFARLNTTYEDVSRFVIPFLIITSLLTFINMIVSVVRNSFSLDYSSKLAVSVGNLMLIMTLFVPFLLISIGMTSPIPAAIPIYWVGNNLWTLLQNIVLYFLLYKTLPFPDETVDFQHTIKRQHKERERITRRHRWGRRLSRLGLIFTPWQREQHKARIAAANKFFEEQQARAAEEKQRRRAISAERRKARQEHLQARRAARKQAAAAANENTLEEPQSPAESLTPEPEIQPREITYWSV